jgi:hypothetical protein
MKSLSLVIMLFLCISLNAQKTIVNGYVSNAHSGEAIIDAVIFEEHSGIYTYTNNFGYFSLNLPSIDSALIRCSYIGYAKQLVRIEAQQRFLNVKLIPNNALEEITVTADIPIEKRLESGTAEIPASQLNKLPVIGSEADIMKAYSLMPGIQSGNEASSGLHVRGGSPDENLILLDDIPLYYVNHLGGFVSVFNADAIKKVSVTKGGFPARYGGRLSSIMEVRMKEGNLKEYTGNFSLGLVGSKLSVEGPIKRDTSSFIVSARGFIWGLLVRPLSQLVTDASVGYDFYDLNAKLNWKFSNKDKIFFSFYKGDDETVVRFKEGLYSSTSANSSLKWGNTLFAGRWNHVFNSRLFVNTIASYTQYRYANTRDYKNSSENQTYDYEFFTGINDYSLRSNFEYNVNKHYHILFGAKGIYHKSSPGFTAYQLDSEEAYADTTYGYDEIYGSEVALYIENHIRINDRLSGNLGFNAAYYHVEDKGYFSPEPRILLNIGITKNSALKLAYSKMQQNVHLLTSNTVSLPMDVWMPSADELPPSQSVQYSTGFFKTLFNGKVEFSIDAYYKNSDNLIAYKEGATLRSFSNNWTDKLEKNGIGTSYGVECLLQKKQGKITGWFSYTYANTQRQFENINNGKAFAYKYDRRHDISITFMYEWKPDIDFSAVWVFGTGYPFTLPIASYEAVNNGTSNIYYNQSDIWYDESILIYADRNAHRMRLYHRLDLSANFRKEKRHGTRTWSISVYNAYNRQNPYYYFTKASENGMKLYQQSLFPTIPSISYSFKF